MMQEPGEKATRKMAAYYSCFLVRMGIVLLLLSVTRIMLYLFNTGLFPGLTTGGLANAWFMGLRYDIPAFLVLNAIYVFIYFLPLNYRTHPAFVRILNILFVAANSAGLALNLIDVIYYRFTLKRMTSDIFSFIGQNRGELKSLFGDFIFDFWYITLIWILLIVFLIVMARNTGRTCCSFRKWPLRRYILEGLVFIFVLLVSFIGVRGGIQLKPLTLIDAGKMTDPRYIPLVLNTPFTVYRTMGKQKPDIPRYFDEKQLEKIYSPLHIQKQSFKRVKNKKNLVIIILESFSKEHSAYFNPGLENGNYKGYTPFLDSLARLSLVFDAWANGKKSMDAVPAILAGIPSLMDIPYINSIYAGNSINGLARILQEEGYSTAFYHGGNNGTMGFESFARLAGYNEYKGRKEYGNDKDFDGKWGIFDEPYLEYCVREFNKMEQPFHTVIFTLSSHHPYTIPEKYKGRFPEGTLDIHASIGYADYALSCFFAAAAKENWFTNTLFILTADHTAEAHYPFYANRLGQFAIPLLFYMPGSDPGGRSPKTAQQTDIMPSALHLLGINKTFICFGSDLFDENSNGFAVNYFNSSYRLLKGGKLLEFDGKELNGMFTFANDSLLQKNRVHEAGGYEPADLDFLKAYIQQYFTRLEENRLIIGN